MDFYWFLIHLEEFLGLEFFFGGGPPLYVISQVDQHILSS